MNALKKDQKTAIVTSALTLNHQDSTVRYKDTHKQADLELSDQEKEEQFQKLHQEYLQQKMVRKKEMERMRREEFGTSSSEDDDVGDEESDSISDKRVSYLQDEHRKSEAAREKVEKKETAKHEHVLGYLQAKKGKEWEAVQLQLTPTTIRISRTYTLQQFHKIKAIKECSMPDCAKLKLSHVSEEEIHLAASLTQMHGSALSSHYFLFAYMVEHKLRNMGLKLASVEQPNYPGVPETIVKNSYIFGKILKKSQILGKWEERFIVVNQEGVFSYKRFNEKHSMFIAAKSLQELWTRFEIVEGMVVIKMLHSNSTKTEFGLPITVLLDRNCWLYYFYSLAFF